MPNIMGNIPVIGSLGSIPPDIAFEGSVAVAHNYKIKGIKPIEAAQNISHDIPVLIVASKERYVDYC